MNDSRLSGLRPAEPGSAQALAALPLIVLVGVTGVGKSTALRALQDLRPDLSLLPDRRVVTDAVMIEPLAGGPVQDREQRFALTARYRESHPGGMAEALGSLALDGRAPDDLLVFDGLRGLEEVRYAAAHHPLWRFVALHAPDLVRLRRLLGRADAFDRVMARDITNVEADLHHIEGLNAVFSADEVRQIAALPEQGHAPQEVLAKARIVVTERRHYDPQAAAAHLAGLPAHRALDLDTLRLSPAEVAARIGEWL